MRNINRVINQNISVAGGFNETQAKSLKRVLDALADELVYLEDLVEGNDAALDESLDELDLSDSA